MDTKKDIGSQVKSIIENHTVSPSDSVWQHLEEKLKEKKKKRRIFFFWLTSGLATLITLFLILFNNNLQFNSKNSKSNIDTTITEKQTPKTSNIKNNEIVNVTNNSKEYDSLLKNNKNKTKEIKANASNNNLTKNKKIKKSQIEKTSYSVVKTNNSPIGNTQKNIVIFNKPDSTNLNTSKSYLKNIIKPLKDSVIVLNTNNSITDKFPLKIIDSTLTKEDKEVIKEEQILSKWSIFPHASIDFYNCFNKSFSKNTTINYGIYFGYLATQDITIRIGVNKLEYKYSQIENNAQQLQELSYIEIPLEIKYKIIDKKVNTSILFGISYLILDDASILNKQNTLSNKSYFEDKNISLNIGLGMQTKLYKRLDFNIEPILKYHLKPHTNESNYSIFTISILAGFEYKF